MQGAVRRLEGYLAWKWGAQSNLVNGHPFKSSRPQFGGSQSITLASTNVPVDASDSVPFMSIFDQPFVLEGSFATSGLDLVYTTNNASVMTIDSDGKLKPVGTGNVTVTVSQPGDTHFSAASARTLAMKIIGKRPQTLTFAEIGETFVNQPLELNATAECRDLGALLVDFLERCGERRRGAHDDPAARLEPPASHAARDPGRRLRALS